VNKRRRRKIGCVPTKHARVLVLSNSFQKHWLSVNSLWQQTHLHSQCFGQPRNMTHICIFEMASMHVLACPHTHAHTHTHVHAFTHVHMHAYFTHTGSPSVTGAPARAATQSPKEHTRTHTCIHTSHTPVAPLSQVRQHVLHHKARKNTHVHTHAYTLHTHL